MKELKNREEIKEQLTNILIEFDIKRHNYQTDIYLYVDEDNTGTLDTFINVGGRSWLNDDHYTLYSDHEHYEDIWDYYNEIDYIASALNINQEELKNKVKVAIDDDVVDYNDIRQYVEDNEELLSALEDDYESEIENNFAEYYEQAEQIISEYEKNEEY